MKRRGGLWSLCGRNRPHASFALAAIAALALLPASGLAAAPRTTIHDVEDEVMCPICGTLLELAESPQAQRERVLVKRLIAAGKSKAEIKDILVAQYGRAVWRCQAARDSTSPPTSSRRSPSSWPPWRWPWAYAAGGAPRSHPGPGAPERRVARRARTPSGSTPTSPATTFRLAAPVRTPGGDRLEAGSILDHQPADRYRQVAGLRRPEASDGRIGQPQQVF